MNRLETLLIVVPSFSSAIELAAPVFMERVLVSWVHGRTRKKGRLAMEIQTTRFGSVGVEPDDIILFPCGLPGVEPSRHWILLADVENGALGWLQSASRAELAFAVVSPRRFFPDYQVRVHRGEIQPLQLQTPHDVRVLVIVSKTGAALTANLKAPLLFNLERRLGRQVVVNDDQPLQYVMVHQCGQLRKSA